MDNEKESRTMMHIRTSPKSLYEAIGSLSFSQKKCVIEMGFGSLLDFKIAGLSSRIVYYLVNNFDDKNLVLNVGAGKIMVTPDLIHDILGVPLGGVQLGNIDGGEGNDNLVVEWSKQYKDRQISLVDLKTRIARSQEADWNFKINFILLFANTIAQCKKRGKCDLSLLDHIREDFRIEQIDWCHYVWHAIRGCKDKWKLGVIGQYFSGPCTLLTLIYVDRTKGIDFEVRRTRPAILTWNNENLKQREESEVGSGGFGNVEMREPYEASGADVENFTVDVNGDIDFVRLNAFKPEGLKGYVYKISNLFKLLRHNNNSLKETLQEAKEKYPDNDDIKEWETKVSEMM
uniref:uncharacterized protein LOC122605915 n=1 Tax=Erigeron canadensis TaxID=72917 RepID=UPI001CB899FE|nr:uncharacterized protein LOC122605915 [Erigeron canadensis]XP_043634811.1 uncharacterized protein LOC122605915 [Erigeron canadensis]